MKKNSIFCTFFIFFFFVCTNFCFSQKSDKPSDNHSGDNSSSNSSAEIPVKISLQGYKLCQSFLDLLEEKDFSPEKQVLIVSEANYYPFNVKVSFPADPILYSKNYTEENLTNLTIAIKLEDAFFYSNMITELLKEVKKLKLDYDLDFIFTYGDSQQDLLGQQLKGTEFFIRNLDNQKEMAAICISFSSEETQVVPGGGGDSSPTWLIKRITDRFNKNKILYKLQSSNITSLYRFDILLEDERTSCFLKEKIPACGIILHSENKDASSKNIINASIDFFTNYTQSGTSQWDRHFYTISFGGTIIWFNERVLTVSFIVLSILSIFLICEFSFNKKTKWLQNHISRHWKIIPATIAVTVAGMYLGQLFVWIISLLIPCPPYTLLTIKMFYAIVIVAIEFLFIYKKGLIHAQEIYGYLTAVAATFNILLFSFIDISLFLLFIAQYIIFYLSQTAKRIISISFFLFMALLPVIPYAVQFIRYIKESSVISLTFCSFPVTFGITLFLLPFELFFIRILAKIRQVFREADEKNRKFQQQNLIAISGALGIFVIIFFVVLSIIPNQYIKHSEKTDYNIQEVHDNLISVKYKDSTFFGETSRELEINLGKQSQQCKISISSQGISPVIYSDEIYTSSKETFTDWFMVPTWPPEKLNFKFITQTEKPEHLMIQAVYPSEADENSFILRTVNLTIPPVQEVLQ